MSDSITVQVPATTANLGSGFDCIGAAFTLYNQFHFSRWTDQPDGVVQIVVSGIEADRVSVDATNLAYQSFTKLYQHLGQPVPAVKLEIQLGVPLARGLGSSATAIVGGLVGANHLAGSPLDQSAVMNLAIALEGHPDNVVPALLGGCRLAVQAASGWEIADIPWLETIVPIVAIPNFELSTAEARKVLPPHYSRADAVFNTAHLGLLLRGLQTGNGNWLKAALDDRIHQPYRKTLIPGYDAVQTAALAAGAHGLVISGAGPTLLTLVDPSVVEVVQETIVATWQQVGITAQVMALAIEHQPCRVVGH